MALPLTPEASFFEQLKKQDLSPTELREGSVTVWKRADEFYTLPLPVHSEKGHTLYCPFAIDLFFKHALGSLAKVDTTEHGKAEYKVDQAVDNVVSIDPHAGASKPKKSK